MQWNVLYESPERSVLNNRILLSQSNLLLIYGVAIIAMKFEMIRYISSNSNLHKKPRVPF